ncbi:sigma 54-interacting transcriptional regulator [Desulfolithobacter dissulfuricans]|uniref:sigma 54-interacting transcriptional regulator n=1 Tax=Desulfolithobacter dissulfuricans TaxID=2795293 RepID=UPI002277C796|nr:sigma 54-interacting transcriptional regulator [Desulfolithobacter dissulfuricans]
MISQLASASMEGEFIVRNLQRSLLFQDVGESELASYAANARVQNFSQGQYVYRQGDPSDVFYIVATGEAELVVTRDDGVKSVVGRIDAGGHFGETGILSSKPHSVGARALCDLVVICFDKYFFKTTILSNQKIHNRLDALLAERLRVAFHDYADPAGVQQPDKETLKAAELILFKEKSFSADQVSGLIKNKNDTIRPSRTAQKIQAAIDRFVAESEPYMITGEAGTGKSFIARQIHSQADWTDGPYQEIDLREYEPEWLERILFGTEQGVYPFAQMRQAGALRVSGGTLVFTNVHLMGERLQRRLLQAIERKTFTPVDSDRQLAVRSRIVFISTFSFRQLGKSKKLLPELLNFFEKHHFHVPPLRKHKKDIPLLISYYLDRYSKEYEKKIYRVSSETLGILMHYDWPGNLTELASVMRRAVMLAQNDEILPEEILLGLPKSEGKWEYNILRIPWIRKFLSSSIFPLGPRIVVGFFLLITVIALFSGPQHGVSNAGITMGWYIGWPLMFFSFFFLARTWCSVCTLAVPGRILQNLVKPQKKTPSYIKNNSGWIMAILCILVFWVEIVWDAYNSPWLTGGIILAVTTGSIIFSVLYSRRSWCRYLCPLGAVNAIFSMPSIVELRSNRHVCLNRCQEHACFVGGATGLGCPMFRHPYLVDNNRDCIMCANCIKNCNNSSIQLNIRLAPNELWTLKNPRKADSFLIISMGAIFFPFALHEKFSHLVDLLVADLAEIGVVLPDFLAGSLIFFTLILVFQLGYYFMVTSQCLYAKIERETLLPLLGYGFIPLILGGFMAVHLEAFISGAGRIVPNIQEWLGLQYSYENIRLISSDSTYVLKALTVIGGLLASLYATYRLTERTIAGSVLNIKPLMIPFSFLFTLAGLFLIMV